MCPLDKDGPKERVPVIGWLSSYVLIPYLTNFTNKSFKLKDLAGIPRNSMIPQVDGEGITLVGHRPGSILTEETWVPGSSTAAGRLQESKTLRSSRKAARYQTAAQVASLPSAHFREQV